MTANVNNEHDTSCEEEVEGQQSSSECGTTCTRSITANAVASDPVLNDVCFSLQLTWRNMLHLINLFI